MANRVAATRSPAADRPAPNSRSRADAKSSTTTVLGIDPGLDRTGYAVLNAGDRRVVDGGLIRTSSRLPLERRLRELEAGLEEVLADHAIDLLAVEELYAHYKHPRTAILMGHARGVVLLAAARRGLDVVSLPATHVKRTLTGNGHASKSQMQRAILATLQLKELPEPADVADAMAIAWCAFATGRTEDTEVR